MKNLVAIVLSLFASVALAADPLSPETVNGATTVDTAQAKALFENGAAFVDTRKDSDWEAGRIPGAIHLELKSAFTREALAAEVQSGDKVVFYCNGFSCLRSSESAAKAVEWGYTNVFYFREGFPAWQAAGNPVE